MSDTTTCPVCSTNLPGVAAFCTNCGTRLTPAEAPAAPPPLPIDPTRVDDPAMNDATQAFPVAAPPAPPIAPPPLPASDQSSPWQPSPPSTGQWAPGPVDNPPAPEVPSWVQAAQSLSTAPPPPAAPAPPYGTAAPTTPAAGKAGGGSPLGALLAMVGGVLTIVGTFLPWVTGNLSDSGLSGWDLTSGDKGFLMSSGSLLTFESADPYALIALGVLALILGALSFGGATRRLARVAAVLVGIGILGLMVRDWTSLAAVVSDQAPADFSVSSAIGFYVAIAGGAVVAISALMPSKAA